MSIVLEVNSGSWEQEVLRSSVLTVVEFWHDGCPWCVKFNPVLDEASEEYRGKIKFVSLNVFKADSDRDLAFKYGIMSTPTIIFFCGGRPVEGLVGFMPKEALKKALDDMLGKHTDCLAQSTELKT